MVIIHFDLKKKRLLTSGLSIGVRISELDPNPDSMDFSTLCVGVLGGGGGGVHFKIKAVFSSCSHSKII